MSETDNSKSVLGFEGLYGVTPGGQILSLERPKFGGFGQCLARILKTFTTPDGYLRVSLSKQGKQVNKLVHTLVAEAFVEKPHGKVEVNHIDGTKANNEFSNLEWVTRVENMAHAKANGLRPIQVGDTAANVILTSHKFSKALAELRAGRPVEVVAAEAGVTRVALRKARARFGISTKRGDYSEIGTHA